MEWYTWLHKVCGHMIRMLVVVDKDFKYYSGFISLLIEMLPISSFYGQVPIVNLRGGLMGFCGGSRWKPGWGVLLQTFKYEPIQGGSLPLLKLDLYTYSCWVYIPNQARSMYPLLGWIYIPNQARSMYPYSCWIDIQWNSSIRATPFAKLFWPLLRGFI